MHEHVEDVAGIVSRFCIRKRAQSYHQQPDGVARRGMSIAAYYLASLGIRDASARAGYWRGDEGT
jgi:hypothetical protein